MPATVEQDDHARTVEAVAHCTLRDLAEDAVVSLAVLESRSRVPDDGPLQRMTQGARYVEPLLLQVAAAIWLFDLKLLVDHLIVG